MGPGGCSEASRLWVLEVNTLGLGNETGPPGRCSPLSGGRGYTGLLHKRKGLDSAAASRHESIRPLTLGLNEATSAELWL